MPGPFNQWLNFFTPKAHLKAASSLYLTIVQQSREPSFFSDCTVPDTVDGRFDMIALHCFLVMNRLKDEGAKASKVSQVLFDEMFSDMDRGLRELGVGDMGVGKRVRAMAKAYLGRVEAYDSAFGEDEGALDAALDAALVRNLFRGEEVDPAAVARIGAYMVRECAAIAGQDVEELLVGKVVFGPAPKIDTPVADGRKMEA